MADPAASVNISLSVDIGHAGARNMITITAAAAAAAASVWLLHKEALESKLRRIQLGLKQM